MCPHAQLQRAAPLGNRKIRCVLAHDHVLLRQGVRRLLDDEPDMEVIAEAGNAAEALQLVSEHRPEVFVTEAEVFRLAADQVEQLIQRKSPQSKVLFLTLRNSDERLRETPGDGTRFTMPQTSAEELAEMVRRAGSAETAELREVPRRGGGEWAAKEQVPRERVLTTREREVVKLLAEGRTVRSAAGILGLSVKTVDAHKFNLMRKLGIHNKAELVMWAIGKRIVKLPANF